MSAFSLVHARLFILLILCDRNVSTPVALGRFLAFAPAQHHDGSHRDPEGSPRFHIHIGPGQGADEDDCLLEEKEQHPSPSLKAAIPEQNEEIASSLLAKTTLSARTTVLSTSSASHIHSTVTEDLLIPARRRCDTLFLRCTGFVRRFVNVAPRRESVLSGAANEVVQNVVEDEDVHGPSSSAAPLLESVDASTFISSSKNSDSHVIDEPDHHLRKNEGYKRIIIKVVNTLSGEEMCDSFSFMLTSQTPIGQIVRAVKYNLRVAETDSTSADSSPRDFFARTPTARRICETELFPPGDVPSTTCPRTKYSRHNFVQVYFESSQISQYDETLFEEWLQQKASWKSQSELLQAEEEKKTTHQGQSSQLEVGQIITLLAMRVSALQHLKEFLDYSPDFDDFDFWKLPIKQNGLEEIIIDPISWNPSSTELRVTEAFAGSRFLRRTKLASQSSSHSQQDNKDNIKNMNMKLKRVKTRDLLSLIFTEGDILNGSKERPDQSYLENGRHLTMQFLAYASKTLQRPQCINSSCTNEDTDELLVQYGESLQCPDSLEIALIHHNRLVLDPRFLAASSLSEYHAATSDMRRNLIFSTVTIRNSERGALGSSLAYGPVPNFWKNAAPTWQRQIHH